MKKNKIFKILIWVLSIPIVLFFITVTIVYYKQDSIVQHLLKTANKDFKGQIVIENSNIAPFANFPYISIDLQGLKIFETKDETLESVVEVGDLYVGFDLFTLLSGNFDVKSIKLSNADINIKEYEDGSFNIVNAFETLEPKDADELSEEFHFDLKELIFNNVDIHKINAEGLEFDTYFNSANVGLKSKDDHLFFSVNADFDLSMIEHGDTTFLRRKNMVVSTVLDYYKIKEEIIVSPSKVQIDEALFNFEGYIDVFDDFNVDLTFSGKKPDFSLIIALAPDDLIPVIQAFENRGDVYFNADVKGPTLKSIPKVEAVFGCDNGYFKNPNTDKILDELSFKGYFTNGEEKTLESMRVEIKDFNARPESGIFKVNLIMENFSSPDIDLKAVTLFDLDYLAKFFNVTQLEKLRGEVALEMNFHDIIDLQNPEKTLEQFNDSYFTKLKIKGLGFKFPNYNQEVKQINVDLQVDGNAAELRNFSFLVGGSDLHVSGFTSDLPAIIHHSSKEVTTKLILHSDAVDINELTLAKGEVVVDEYIRDFNMEFSFTSSAKALTESPYLPIGKFSIDHLSAKLTNYPHALNNFKADISIDTNNLFIHNFSGKVDKSDVQLKAAIEKYPLWFQDTLTGDTKIALDINSELLQLKDVFSFDGENFIPEDFRDEEINELKVHFDALLHFYSGALISADVDLTELSGKANLHPMKLERFNGRLHIENDHLTLNKFKGKIGNTSFSTDLVYYYGGDQQKKQKDNYLRFNAPVLDFDQLVNYEAPDINETVEHDSVFSIFDIPFPDMKYSVKIGKMNYHNYLISNLNAELRTNQNHMLFVDTLQFDIVGGHIDIGGYFNGANREQIYFNTNTAFQNIDLDKLMLKFDNFGQDEIISDNLHGTVGGKLWGNIHMHADLVPIIDDSDISLEIDIVGGSIENFGPLEALSGFFEDEKLHKVIFDTLSNKIEMQNGVMTIPEMLINTNLGFIKVSGKQDMNMNMEYYLRVPLKMITSVGANKLFKNRKDTNPEELGEYDPNKNYRFVNIKIVGDAEDFKVTLGRNK